jgi:hypothetical protein
MLRVDAGQTPLPDPDSLLAPLHPCLPDFLPGCGQGSIFFI